MTPPPLPCPRVPDHALLARIGGGSYGEVWLARSITGRLRAVKVVWRQHFSCDRPYEREFRGIVQFEPISRSHPSVVNVLHVGRDDDADCFFYVMELADDAASSAGNNSAAATVWGEALFDENKAVSAAKTYVPRTLGADLKARGRLPLSEVLELGIQLANALAHLHRHGLVHRDVKPSNVIFVHGQAKLADIGLVTGKDESRSFVGTEGFIPPEGPGSERADLFGLGRLLYEAATGKDRCEFPELPEDLDRWPPDQRKTLLELNEVLARACSPDPAKRHAHADELAADLNLILAGRSVRRAYGVERRLRQVTAVSLAALALVVMVLFSNWFLHRQKEMSEARASLQERLRKQTERAEGQARERLRESLRQQALALAASSEPERRVHALAALKQAAEIRPGLDLRNAAAIAFSTPELRVVRQWNTNFSRSHGEHFDALLKRYARFHPDGSVSICGVEDDRAIIDLPAIATRAQLADFSPDGRWLAVQYSDQNCYLWDLANRSSRRLLQDGASVQAFSPESRYVAMGCSASHLHLFEVKSGKELWSASVSSPLTAIHFHPRAPLIVGGAEGESHLRFFSLVDGRVEREALLPELGRAVRWSNDGSLLISTHADFSVRVWDWPNLDSPQLLLRFHLSEPVCLACDPSDRWLATSGWDNQCGLFDLRNGQLVLSLRSSQAYPAADRPAFVFFNDNDWTLEEFDPPIAPETIAIHEHHKSPRVLAFSPDGRWLATGGGDGVRLVRWDDRQTITLETNLECVAVTFSADSATLYAMGTSGAMCWRLCTTAQKVPRQWQAARLPASLGTARAESTVAAFGPDHRRWIVEAQAPDRRRWGWLMGNLEEPQPTFCDRITRGVEHPDFCPSGRWLAWGNWQHEDAFVMDLRTNSPPVRLESSGSTSAKFSPDGRLLAIGGSRSLQFLETDTWRVKHSVRRDPRSPLPPLEAFTSDSRICAAVFPPNGVQLIDTESGQELVRLQPHANHLLSRAVFSPDNRFLAVASEDHHLLIWDIAALRTSLAELDLDWSPARLGQP
jgi:WD40 repeat protein